MPEAEMKTAVITVSTSVASGQGEDGPPPHSDEDAPF